MSRWVTLAIIAGLAACQTGPQLAPNPPLKQYKAEVFARMNVVWSRLTARYTDQLAEGTIKIRFRLQPDGRVLNLRVVSNSGNQALSDIATRTVQQTKIPPIPLAVLAELPEGYISFDLNFKVVDSP